ncbi:MAG: hypothetical protein HZA93_06480 [Verrucomicrobia bacterium]|nr:hypothetical protein [Verrucomicrobiota bacterium]
MAQFGKALVFFLKYFAEMQRLYERDEDGRTIPEIDSKQNRKEVLGKVDAVGAIASDQIAALLDLCTQDWLKDLKRKTNGVAVFGPERTGAYVRRNWEWSIFVRRPRQRTRDKAREIGIGIYDSSPTVLTPWVWGLGGVAVEPLMIQWLKVADPAAELRRSKEHVNWSGGAVSFSPISIPLDEAVDFELNVDDFVDRTRKALGIITPQFIEKFLELG